MHRTSNHKRILLFWNGMTSRQVSGGDVYIKQLVEHSDDMFDVVSTKHVLDILRAQNAKSVFVTDSKDPNSSLDIMVTYVQRAISSARYAHAHSRHADFDIALASSPFVCDIIPAVRSRANHKTVVFFHLIPKRKSNNHSMRIRFWLARIEQWFSLIIINRYFDTILVGNEEVRQELSKKMPNKKFIIAHAGIDTKKIESVKNQKKDPNLAIFIGRLTAQKGVLDLVEVVRHVQQVRPEFRLIIVGEGPHRALIEDKIKEQSISGIHLFGFIDDQEKYKLLRRASLFLFPSYEEGWGIALAEGLYAGCNTICYELPHYKGIFGDFPHYIMPGDIGRFAEAVLDSYKTVPPKEQTEFIGQYDYSVVTKDILNQISGT